MFSNEFWWEALGWSFQFFFHHEKKSSFWCQSAGHLRVNIQLCQLFWYQNPAELTRVLTHSHIPKEYLTFVEKVEASTTWRVVLSVGNLLGFPERMVGQQDTGFNDKSISIWCLMVGLDFLNLTHTKIISLLASTKSQSKSSQVCVGYIFHTAAYNCILLAHCWWCPFFVVSPKIKFSSQPSFRVPGEVLKMSFARKVGPGTATPIMVSGRTCFRYSYKLSMVDNIYVYLCLYIEYVYIYIDVYTCIFMYMYI